MRFPRYRPRPVVAGLLPVVLLLLNGCQWLPKSPSASPPPVVIAPPPAPVGPPPFDPTAYAMLHPRCMDNRVPVIMYHDVVKERGRKSVWFDITRKEFSDQLDWLRERGATPVTLAALHEHLTTGKALPDGAVVLTFDDNYQGFYDNAYPLLKKYGYPAAMFVHTNFVGDKADDHPKMDWNTLKKLDKEGLVTIGSHTLSHPDDIRLMKPEEQEEELMRSKALLEQQLGHAIPYFAYPNGKNSGVTRSLARQVGYTMAFTIENGQAEESPEVLAINRYVHTRLEKAWEDREKALKGAPAAIVDMPLKVALVRLQIGKYADITLGLAKGGVPKTWRVAGRESVGHIVQEAKGVAGINAAFFSDAKLESQDNTIIGPCQTSSGGGFSAEMSEEFKRRIANRPVVLMGPTRMMILPFSGGAVNDEFGFRALMPDFTDAFVAGAWLVHNGVARTRDEIDVFGVGDAEDVRPRAFFGVTADGEAVCGATMKAASTWQMAKAAAEAGVVEAVLLDSGYSTSLVYNEKIIARGHQTKAIPSRSVPHAIVLTGDLELPTDTDTLEAFNKSDPALTVPTDDEKGSDVPRRRRRRKH